MKKKVKELAKQHQKIQSLMRHVNEKTLLDAHEKQPNSDTKQRYGEGVDKNINVLLKRMKKSSYFPQSRYRYSKSSSDEWNLEHEFKVFEDEIVADVFKEILMSIYEIKGCVTVLSGLNESESIVKSQCKRMLLPMLCDINLSRPICNADKEELIAFLKENIADKKFMQYIKRFLQSGILESGNKLEIDSRGMLALLLNRIFIYHRLRDWLTSKRGKETFKMKFWMDEEKFSFAFWNSDDLLLFRRMLLCAQNELGLEAGIEMPKAFQKRCKIQCTVRRVIGQQAEK